jgi:hypothetical protein
MNRGAHRDDQIATPSSWPSATGAPGAPGAVPVAAGPQVIVGAYVVVDAGGYAFGGVLQGGGAVRAEGIKQCLRVAVCCGWGDGQLHRRQTAPLIDGLPT